MAVTYTDEEARVISAIYALKRGEYPLITAATRDFPHLYQRV